MDEKKLLFENFSYSDLTITNNGHEFKCSKYVFNKFSGLFASMPESADEKEFEIPDRFPLRIVDWILNQMPLQKERDFCMINTHTFYKCFELYEFLQILDTDEIIEHLLDILLTELKKQDSTNGEIVLKKVCKLYQLDTYPEIVGKFMLEVIPLLIKTKNPIMSVIPSSFLSQYILNEKSSFNHHHKCKCRCIGTTNKL